MSENPFTNYLAYPGGDRSLILVALGGLGLLRSDALQDFSDEEQSVMRSNIGAASLEQGNLADAAMQKSQSLADLVDKAAARLNVKIPTYAADRAALKALDATKDALAYLKEDGREGIFEWTAGNFSTQITADTQEGLYLKADAIASTDGAWVRVFNGVGSLTWFGANGAGDIWPAILGGAAFGGEWKLPKGDYSLAGSARTLSASNFKLRGEPGTRVAVTVGTSLTISGTDTSIEGIFFDSNQVTRAGVLFEVTGKRCSISRNRFAGVFSIFIRDAGTSNEIISNVFDAFVTTVCPIIIKGVNTKCCLNEMDDYFGFGIQAFDGAKDVLIANNTIKAQRWDQTRVATAGQTVFTVNFGRNDVQRFGLLVNGRRVTFTVDITDSSPRPINNVTFTLGVPLTGGETVTMYAWRSLENINVNFKTSGVKVINNTCDGTGDGNIVVASGYSTVSDADYPHDVIITGNTCRNAAASGIGVSKSRGGVISGNVVVDVGYGLADGATGLQVSSLFMSGIYLPKEPGWNVGGNRVVRDVGFTYYGIAFSLAGDTSYADFRGFEARHKVGVNFVENVQERKYFAFSDSSATTRQVDIDIEDVTWTPYPESLQSLINIAGWGTRPTSTTYWTTATNASGWTRNTANTIGHPACVETNDNSYVDCIATAYALFANGFIRVSFTAKASAAGQSGYISAGVSHVADGDTAPLSTVNITDTAPKRYQITMAVDTIDAFLLRIGGATTNGKIYVTDIRLEYAPADVG